MDKERFKTDIENSPLMNYNNIDNVTELTALYDNTLSSIFELHASPKKRIVTLRPASQWYTDEIRVEKVKRRRLDRLWRANRLTINREIYTEQCNVVNRLIYQSKMGFYSALIEENNSNQAVLFTAVNKMLNRKVMNKLPSHDDASVLANKFADFFVEKIKIIRNDLTTEADVSEYHQSINTSPGTGHELHDYTPTTEEELSTLLSRMIGKSWILNPIYRTVASLCV